MLFFLDFASRSGIDVVSYIDAAEGHMKQCDDGKTRMVRVELNPVCRFASGCAPGLPRLRELHSLAHEHCYIANSVTADVVTNIVDQVRPTSSGETA